MTEHLSPEKIKLLLDCRLKGDELVEALRHMETCDECRLRLPEENPGEVIDRLLGDEKNDESKTPSKPAKSKTSEAITNSESSGAKQSPRRPRKSLMTKKNDASIGDKPAE